MNVVYRKRFLKKLSKIPSEARSKIEDFVFKDLRQANSLSEIGVIEKLKGYPSFFKVRFGSYRVGLRKENDTIILEKALHRKDIYRYFP